MSCVDLSTALFIIGIFEVLLYFFRGIALKQYFSYMMGDVCMIRLNSYKTKPCGFSGMLRKLN